MEWYIWVFIFFIWHIIGFIVTGIGASCSGDIVLGLGGALSRAKGLEFVNPCFIYKYNNVNWFGAIMVCIVYSLAMPACTVCYWFYKLCTVGRKAL